MYTKWQLHSIGAPILKTVMVEKVCHLWTSHSLQLLETAREGWKLRAISIQKWLQRIRVFAGNDIILSRASIFCNRYGHYALRTARCNNRIDCSKKQSNESILEDSNKIPVL